MLILSFAGAALSYSMVGLASSVHFILFSRIVVGLVKQTMTVSSALIAEWTAPTKRAAALGRLGEATIMQTPHQAFLWCMRGGACGQVHPPFIRAACTHFVWFLLGDILPPCLIYARLALHRMEGTAMTLGWMSGQSVGGVLGSRVHMAAPAAAAVMLYGVNILWASSVLSVFFVRTAHSFV